MNKLITTAGNTALIGFVFSILCTIGAASGNTAPNATFCETHPGHTLCLDFEDGKLPVLSGITTTGDLSVVQSPFGGLALRMDGAYSFNYQGVPPSLNINYSAGTKRGSLDCQFSATVSLTNSSYDYLSLGFASLTAPIHGQPFAYTMLALNSSSSDSDMRAFSVVANSRHAPNNINYGSTVTGSLRRFHMHMDRSRSFSVDLKTGVRVDDFTPDIASYNNFQLSLGYNGAQGIGGSTTPVPYTLYYDDIVCDLIP